MQLKSKPPQPVAVEGNDLPNFMFPVNSLEVKGLLESAKYLGRELKDVILFIALSMLLLLGISLLPESSVPVQEEHQQQVQQLYVHYQSSTTDWLR